ncbi:MAG: hypothetical protein H0W02_15875 [Ktedonobacteraceae bacterium]|nr:hypothetical protein [Ktedonobacteraceae bacterium]
MSQQLTGFFHPATDPLSTIKNQAGYLSTTINSFNQQFRRQAANLISGKGNTDFQGIGADTFSKAIEYYLEISNQHSSMLEQTSTITQTCISQITVAVDTANAKNLNGTLVGYVLGRVTLDEVIQHGSTPIEIVLQEIRSTLHKMQVDIQNYANDTANAGKSFGQAFSDFFHGNFGGAWHDLQQSGGDFIASLGDFAQFGLDNLDLVWESVFELTAAALIQCAQEVWQAVNTCASAISDLVAKVAHFISDLVKDEQTFMTDLHKGDYTGALNVILKDFIDPELSMMGLQQVSASQIEEIIKEQAPGLWAWLQSLPWWVVPIVLAAIAATIVGIMVTRMFIIQAALANMGVTVTKGQIWSLLWKGYSNQSIEAILRTTSVQNSEGMTRTITNPDGSLHTFTAHTMREHVGISDASMINTTSQNNRAGGKGVQTSFPDLAIAQNAVNYAIAHSSVLQDFIRHGAAGSSAHDVQCSTSLDFGHGYVRIIDRRGRIQTPPRRIGPLHCVYVLIAKNIFGVPYIEDAYPTES